MSRTAEASSPSLGFVLVVFGGLRGLQKRFTEAAELHDKAIRILDRHLSPEHPQMLTIRTNYAIVLRKLNRKQEASQLEHDVRVAASKAAADAGARHKINVFDLQRETK